MRVLVLFSGTGSVERAFRAAGGWEITSLDVDPRSPADIHEDILDFDFGIWEPGHFDAVWASPPCTEYSVARTTARRPRDLEYADSLVQCALDAIGRLRPRAWWIENPDSGLLKTRDVVRGLPFLRVSYCMYGAPYRKTTRLWTNVPAEVAGLRVCDRQCGSFADGHHAGTAQRGPSRRFRTAGYALDELHALPEGLTARIEAATRAFLLAPSVPSP